MQATVLSPPGIARNLQVLCVRVVHGQWVNRLRNSSRDFELFKAEQPLTSVCVCECVCAFVCVVGEGGWLKESSTSSRHKICLGNTAAVSTSLRRQVTG
jgi:hypothetical protein